MSATRAPGPAPSPREGLPPGGHEEGLLIAMFAASSLNLLAVFFA